MRIFHALWLILALWAAPVGAQHLSLAIGNGGATLDARNVSLQQILAEWTRVGGATVIMVNDQKIAAPNVTLLLRDMSEREALEILLRDVSGYLFTLRKDAAPGRSVFERIVILPASTAARSTPTPALASQAQRVPQINSIALPAMSVDDDVEAVEIATTTSPARTDPTGRSSAADSVDAVESEANVTDAPVGGGRATGGVQMTGGSDGIPPPTMIQRPQSPMPSAGNPFGDFPGAANPGGVASTEPPPGFVYPPVTNPDAEAAGQNAPPVVAR